jgi:ankyrin repeat protein
LLTILSYFPCQNERDEKSPQKYLDELLHSRGYCARSYCSLEGGYYCKPTPLQKASYGIKLIDVIRRSDAQLLKSMLQAGLSPNPCNSFGESAVHMVCRRGDHKLLQVFLQAGCSLQITDDFGRTPLHDACWTSEPQFDVIDLILQTDIRLLHIVDCRGSSPLSYVKKEHWSSWIKYLESRQNRYWPIRSIAQQGEEPPPPLCMEAPNTRPVEDPPNALSVEVAQQLSSGKLTPDSLAVLQHAKLENDLQVLE